MTAVPGPSSLLRRATVALLALATGATAACVGDRPTLATKVESTDTTVGETTTTAPTPPAKVAQAKGASIDVFDDATTATASGQVTAETATSAPDIPIVFLVKDEEGDRVEVYLPTPPPGGTAWVRKADVSLSSVAYRIEVSLSEHRLRVFRGDEALLDEQASIGVADRPSPGDTYYLKELLQAPVPDGPYGTYAYGLSGYTTRLASIAEGSGVIGIHGTDDPSSIGKDVATGCIGLANDVIARLVDDIGLPLGTPVEIRD